jgi:UDP-N-acetylglucosamine 2-epimerase (non-hydrolysing)
VIIFVAGARPNFVKLAPLVRAFTGERTIVHTGQHFDHAMAGVFFEQLGIPRPDRDLGIAGARTANLMEAFGADLDRHRARGVVVLGDVASTMACALAAATRGIPVAHVEAGLRSFDRTMPEEVHRVVTDAVSELLFASEPAAIANLAREGRADGYLAGNVMIDTLIAQLPAARELAMSARFEIADYVVATVHRPANVDDPAQLSRLCALLQELARDRPVVFPVHPRTRARLGSVDGVMLVPPLGYREFLGLVDGARCVVTDSGGVQEETSYLGIPCFTLRPNTERPCTIELGTNRLVTELAAVPALVREATRRAPVTIEGWDGHAAERIADRLATAWR